MLIKGAKVEHYGICSLQNESVQKSIDHLETEEDPC